MKYHKTPFVVAAVAVMLVSATFALADYYFEGTGTGDCLVGGGTYYPWANWDGHIHSGQTNNPFHGYWWHGNRENPDHDGDANCYNNYNVMTGCYGVQDYGTWDCNQQMNLHGSFTGGFCPGSDTAGGTWWKYDNSCDGTWAGNNAD